MNGTVDASVFVTAARSIEKHYSVSLEFLKQLQERAVNIFCPTLVLVECSAAIARQTDEPVLAEEIVTLIESFSSLHLISLAIPRARRAAHIAATYRLRGADSVYVAVAEEFSATLITWDAEMLQRCPAIVPVITPSGWMEEQGIHR